MAKKQSIGKTEKQGGDAPQRCLNAGEAFANRVNADPELATSIAKCKAKLSDSAVQERNAEIQGNTQRTIGELTSPWSIPAIELCASGADGLARQLVENSQKQMSAATQAIITGAEDSQKENTRLVAEQSCVLSAALQQIIDSDRSQQAEMASTVKGIFEQSVKALDCELHEQGLPCGSNAARALSAAVLFGISEDEFDEIPVENFIREARVVALREKWKARIQAEAGRATAKVDPPTSIPGVSPFRLFLEEKLSLRWSDFRTRTKWEEAAIRQLVDSGICESQFDVTFAGRDLQGNPVVSTPRYFRGTGVDLFVMAARNAVSEPGLPAAERTWKTQLQLFDVRLTAHGERIQSRIQNGECSDSDLAELLRPLPDVANPQKLFQEQLAERLSELGIANGTVDDPMNDGVPHERPCDSPFLGISVNRVNKTLSREGRVDICLFNAPEQWQLFESLYDAAGQPLPPVVVERLTAGDASRAASQNRTELNGRLTGFGVKVVGRGAKKWILAYAEEMSDRI